MSGLQGLHLALLASPSSTKEATAHVVSATMATAMANAVAVPPIALCTGMSAAVTVGC